MSYEIEENCKVFDTTDEIYHTMFNLFEKIHESQYMNFERTLSRLSRMKIVRHYSGDVLRINGVLEFDDEKNISSIRDKGYEVGNDCIIKFKKTYESSDTVKVHCIYGHFVFCKPVPSPYNRKKCSEMIVTMDFKFSSISGTQTEQCCLKDLFRGIEHSVVCKPKRKLFNKVDEVIDFFKNFWNSRNGKIMANVLLEGHDYRKVFCIKNVPELKSPNEESLTVNQKRAAIAMASSYLVTIVEAPAGTGKTQTIVSAILSNLLDKQLIVCNTDIAADAVVSKIRKWYPRNGRVIRLKSNAASARFPDIHNVGENYWYNMIMAENFSDFRTTPRYYYESYIKTKHDFVVLLNDIIKHELDWDLYDKLDEVAKELDKWRDLLHCIVQDTFNCSIYVCTIDYAVLHLKKKFPVLQFNKIFFDEGSQVKLCDVLLILAMYPNAAFSILGDTKQLPPLMKYKMALSKKEIVLFNNAMVGLKNNIYATSFTFNMNFRSHPEIVALASKVFYETRLEARMEEYDPKILINGIYFILKNIVIDKVSSVYPFYFLDIRFACSLRSTYSIYNEGEAENIAIYYMKILKTNKKPSNIGIICFYKDQVETIRKAVLDELEKPENNSFLIN